MHCPQTNAPGNVEYTDDAREGELMDEAAETPRVRGIRGTARGEKTGDPGAP